VFVGKQEKPRIIMVIIKFGKCSMKSKVNIIVCVTVLAFLWKNQRAIIIITKDGGSTNQFMQLQ
jgi:hypothetical protein